MSTPNGGIMLIGYGNPGRMDDGLGPALVKELEKLNLPSLDVEADYQLVVEDAELISHYESVVFADAEIDCQGPFSFKEIQPENTLSFTSHSLLPQAVLALSHDLFNAETRGYVLGIGGYVFDEFGQELSEQAQANLAEALKFVKSIARNGIENIDKNEKIEKKLACIKD